MFLLNVDYKNLVSKVLEDSNKVAIMIFIYVEGKSKKSDIYNNMVRSDRMHIKLDQLAEVGLIKLDHRPFENNSTYVELTPLGQSVAKKLMEIEHLMQGDARDEMADDRVDHGAPSEEGNKVR